MLLLLKNVVFTLVVPGTTWGLLPYLVLSRNPAPFPSFWGAAQVAALPLILSGVLIYVRCVWDFAHRGGATPAPTDPPHVLVVEGLYQYVRNPLYLRGLLVLLGEVLFFQSGPLAVYAATWFLIVHLFTVFYEEPTLQRKFDGSYQMYRQAVHRWRPGKRYRPHSTH